MTKRKPDAFEQPEMAVHETEPSEPPAVVRDVEPASEPAEPDVLQRIIRQWMDMPTDAPYRIAAGLHAAGIHTQDQLAHANVNLVRRALMAALGADAHSLTAAAARFKMEE